MPENTRVHRCVEKLKKQGKKGINPYAVCQASTHQSFATGKSKRKKDGKRVGNESFDQKLAGAIDEVFTEQVVLLSTASGIKAEHLKRLSERTPPALMRTIAVEAMAHLHEGAEFDVDSIADVELLTDRDGQPNRLKITYRS